MEEEQQFCLRWNNFQANITSQFEALRDEEDFVDVTLACDGQRIKAHRVVLSACSPYFKELFRSNPCTHPILFMRDVEFQHLQSLVEFMYAGEVNVAQAHLSSFLRTAESLQIRGLTEAPQRHKQDPKLPTDSTLTTTSVMQQITNTRPRSSSPQESSQQNTSSPEEDDDEDLLSISPSSSPPPAKRAKEQEESTTVPPPPSSQPVTPDASQQIESSYKDDSPDLFEPKMEAPDYSSDGESKGGGFFGLDNSMDNPFSALHGSLDMFAGPSGQGFAGEASHDAAQAYHQKLHSLDPRPCPICNRMYSNLSNLRQHVRLIHNPQTVACPLCSKPFKTKLYLKRHLMSFHELQCTNPVSKQNVVQGSPDFFPPPQVFLGPLASNSHPIDDKVNLHNSLSKMKDYSPEYFHLPYHNLSNNGERPYSSQMGNAHELPSFSASQVSKEEVENNAQTTNSEKPGMKNRENSFVNSPPQVNSDFRSAFIPQQLGHGHPPNSDGLTTYANTTNNEKSQSFLSTLSLSKNGDVADYLNPDIHVNDQASPKHSKESETTANNN